MAGRKQVRKSVNPKAKGTANKRKRAGKSNSSKSIPKTKPSNNRRKTTGKKGKSKREHSNADSGKQRKRESKLESKE